jgi:hypothetical protein
VLALFNHSDLATSMGKTMRFEYRAEGFGAIHFVDVVA